MNKKLWSGRFKKKTHPLVDEYTASISFDQQLAYEDILGSLAHVEMLAHCNILTKEEKNKIEMGLKQIAQELMEGKIIFRLEDEDIHMNIERLLHDRIGEVAGKLHTARSRNDQVALDIHLYLRKEVVHIINLLVELQSTLLNMALENPSVILPGYTHLQRAQPIFLSQHFIAYVSMLQRDIERLQDNWKRINQSPLGACALAGTTFPTDRLFVSRQLGFEGVYENTLDAVSDRDFVIEFLSASSLIMMHLSRLSEELILWSSQEFNFIQFDDAYCTGSSIMPQKKNPDIAELARGKTGRVYGALFALLTLFKGVPLAYNKDFQEDKEPLFDVIRTLSQTLRIYQPMLSTLKINSENMRNAAQEGYLNATALAEYLVKNGLAFRQAHEITGKMVAFCAKKSCRLEDLTVEEMHSFSPLISEDVYSILLIDNAAAACNKSDTQASCASHDQNITSTKAWVLEKQTLIDAVCARLELTL